MPRPKPPSQRIRGAKPGDVGILPIAPSDRAELPELASIWADDSRMPLPVTVEAWDQLRSATHVQRLVETTADVPELLRWAQLFDMRARAVRDLNEQPTVPTTKGTPTMNPLWKVVKHCDVELGKIADRFGLNLLSRVRLGVELATAHERQARLDHWSTWTRNADDVDDVIDIADLWPDRGKGTDDGS